MRTSLALMLSFVLFASAAAQKPAAGGKTAAVSNFKLIAITVAGTKRYSAKEIAPASGLQIGQNAAESDFQQAATRLGKTGLFTDVSYSYSFSPAGTKLELQLADVEVKQLVPAHFENFVWFTTAELTNELQRRVPLYRPLLPIAGNMADEVQDALQTLLDERGLRGRVEYLRESPQDGGDLTGIAFRVTNLEIRIRNVEFPGATPEQTTLLTAAAHKLTGAEYERSGMAAVAQFTLLPVYRQMGYLKAEFGMSEAHVVAPSASGEASDSANDSPNQIEVDAILPVTPGKVYRASEVNWKGNSTLPAEQLQGLLHLKVGQPVDAVRLTSDLEGVVKLYHRHGLMRAHVTSEPQFDDEHATVRYEITVTEGEQFLMGELEVLCLDSQTRARIQEAWTLREGQPYNADYAQEFLQKNLRVLPGNEPWNASIHETVNEKDKTVDVTLRFMVR